MKQIYVWQILTVALAAYILVDFAKPPSKEEILKSASQYQRFANELYPEPTPEIDTILEQPTTADSIFAIFNDNLYKKEKRTGFSIKYTKDTVNKKHIVQEFYDGIAGDTLQCPLSPNPAQANRDLNELKHMIIRNALLEKTVIRQILEIRNNRAE